jgi:hypothetical protein
MRDPDAIVSMQALAAIFAEPIVRVPNAVLQLNTKSLS